MNIQTDIAHCTSCNNVLKISESFSDNHFLFDIDDPPPGVLMVKDFNQILIRATTRSAVAFFLVPFMLVWSGGSLGGIYGGQIISGKFDLFQSLFGIPFILGSVIFWAVTLMSIWGKVVMILNNEGGQIFTGLGNIGITKSFKWMEVSSISEEKLNSKYQGSKGRKILIEGKKRISFGYGLSSERSYYILMSLQKIRTKISKGGRI